MNREEERAQTELRGVVEELKGIHSRLLSLAATLPSVLDDTLPGVDGETDVAAEMRAIIECVLADQIGPAVRDLTAVVEHRKETP